MTTLVKIDGEEVQLEEFIRVLKLTGQFQELLEQFVRDRLAARGARKAGLRVSEEEIQERADQYRRVRGLHRAVDMAISPASDERQWGVADRWSAPFEPAGPFNATTCVSAQLRSPENWR